MKTEIILDTATRRNQREELQRCREDADELFGSHYLPNKRPRLSTDTQEEEEDLNFKDLFKPDFSFYRTNRQILIRKDKV